MNREPSPPRPDGPPDVDAPLSDADYKVLGEFRRAIREFLAFSEEGAVAQGVTAQQHQALLAIRAHTGSEAMTVGELAEALMIRSHSAVGLVSRLEQRDLVARRPSPEDRRRALLELRPKGAQVLEAISVRNLRKIDEAAEILNEMVRMVRRLEPGAQAAQSGQPAAASRNRE